MDISYIKLPQYNAPPKQLILINDKPFCLARSRKQASIILSYLGGYDADIKDGKIKKMCDKVLLSQRKGNEND